MFSVPHYSNALNALRQEKGIAGEFNHNLISVDPSSKTATFEIMAGDKKGEKVEKEFGILHVVPPMGPLGWVKESGLADAAGWVDVDQGSLQHKKYENIFSLGDASSLPTSKVSLLIFFCMYETVQEAEEIRLQLLSPLKLLYLPTTLSHSYLPVKSQTPNMMVIHHVRYLQVEES